MNKDYYGSFKQKQNIKDRKYQKRDDQQSNSQKKSQNQYDEEEDNSQSMIKQQIYYKSSGLTNFMILDQIKQNITFPVPKIKVDFRNVFLNSKMQSFFARELEQKSPTMNDFAFNFQNMFYTKILYSGIFNNVYCACNMRPDGVFNIRFDTDVQDSYRLRFIRAYSPKSHRFCCLGGHAELNGVFGFCERISYQANLALLFDNQMRHSAKYELSIPFLGDFGSLRAKVGVTKRRVDESLQSKRRKRQITFYPFEWQNTYFSYSFNSLTYSRFEPFTSDAQRLYFLSMDYGINRVFRNKHARKFFNTINDVAFINNRLVQKDYFTQHEVKVAYSIPEQRFQLKNGALLKYSYSFHNKMYAGNSVGFKSIFKAKCNYFQRKKFLFTSSVETGMQMDADVGSDIYSRSSLEGSSGGSNNSNLELSLPQMQSINYNNLEIQNVPGYYQLYRDNKNLSFYFAIRNKLYLRKLNIYGFKPFIHANFYKGNQPSLPVINFGIGATRHFNLIDTKVDFLLTTPNILLNKNEQDNEFTKLQIIFNP